MSKRTDRKKANRRPHWTRRATEALSSAPAGVATQYDLARTQIRQVPMFVERDGHWRALAVTLAAFNARFVGADLPDPAGRMAGAERTFKAQHSAVDQVAAAYDTARKYLRRIADAGQQEQQWRELEDELRRFNERFSRDRRERVA